MAFWTPAGVPTTSRLATRQEHWLRRVTAYVEHRQYQVVRSPAQLLWNGSVRIHSLCSRFHRLPPSIRSRVPFFQGTHRPSLAERECEHYGRMVPFNGRSANTLAQPMKAYACLGRKEPGNESKEADGGIVSIGSGYEQIHSTRAGRASALLGTGGVRHKQSPAAASALGAWPDARSWERPLASRTP